MRISRTSPSMWLALGLSGLVACGDKVPGVDDQDGDGYAAVERGGTDCDDADPAVHPGADDAWYDGVDADCAGDDDGDADGDGAAWVGVGGGDCDDADPAVHPGAVDAATDGVDQDCDAVDGPDADGDGFADAATGGTDCDDTDPSIHPRAVDPVGDGVDANCDGVDGLDADGDGFHAGQDCDDGDATVHPGASDADVDGVDQDCDGLDGRDADGDGFADAAGGGPDCDDADPAVHPAAVEVCGDGVDNDCDGGGGVCAVQGDLEISDVGIAIRSEVTQGGTGWAVSGAGDLNGDGIDDVLVGVPTYYIGGWEPGEVYAVYGPVSANNDGEFDLRYADARIVGEGQGDRLGEGLASLGDLDGDGYGDIAVGAPSHDGAEPDMGAAFVIYGPITGRLSAADADVELQCDPFHTLDLGAELHAGDIDGDGEVELLIGHGRLNLHEAYVLDVPEAGTYTADADYTAVLYSSRSSWTGGSLGSGDLDGDGVADIVVGSPVSGWWADPMVHVLLEPPTGLTDLSEAGYDWVGGEGSILGSAVAVVPDTNGDGLDDLVIGSNEAYYLDNTMPGRVHVVHGRAAWTGGDLPRDADGTWIGEAIQDRAGEAVVGLGDWDGDGLGEVAVSACQGEYTLCSAGDGAGPGFVYILGGGELEGTHSLADARARIVGVMDDAATGASLAAAGDLNDDGLQDLLVGAPYQRGPSGEREGAAWLVFSPEGL